MLLHPENRDTESPWWKMFLSEVRRLDTGMLDVLAGPRGRGKTALACMLLGHRCWMGEQFKYTTGMDLLQHIKDGFDKPSTNVKAVYAKTPTLVIDEFHRCDPSDWAHRTIESIIDDRYRNKRDTILITNDKPEQFVRQAGESIASRVKECGEVLVLSGRDYRERGDD
jgi:DNA replication protein DnaC